MHPYAARWNTPAWAVVVLLCVTPAGCVRDDAAEADYAFLQLLEFDHRDTPASERLLLRRDEEAGRCAAGLYAPERGSRIWFLLNGATLRQLPGGGTSISAEEAATIRAFCTPGEEADALLARMVAAPAFEAPPGAPPAGAPTNARFFELAREYLEATPAAHPLLDLSTGSRDESQVLTRSGIRVTVIFTFGLAAYDGGHTATVEMNPEGELLAVTVSWSQSLVGDPG